MSNCPYCSVELQQQVFGTVKVSPREDWSGGPRELSVLVCPRCLHWTPCNQYGQDHLGQVEEFVKRINTTVGQHDNRLDQLEPAPPFDSGNCSTCDHHIPRYGGIGSCQIGNDTQRAACCYHTGLIK